MRTPTELHDAETLMQTSNAETLMQTCTCCFRSDRNDNCTSTVSVDNLNLDSYARAPPLKYAGLNARLASNRSRLMLKFYVPRGARGWRPTGCLQLRAPVNLPYNARSRAHLEAVRPRLSVSRGEVSPPGASLEIQTTSPHAGASECWKQCPNVAREQQKGWGEALG